MEIDRKAGELWDEEHAGCKWDDAKRVEERMSEIESIIRL